MQMEIPSAVNGFPIVMGLLVPEWVGNWVTPIWLLGVGSAAGLVGLILLWGIVRALAAVPAVPLGFRRMAIEIPLTVREGFLFPVFWMVTGAAFFGLFGGLFAHRPTELLAALGRLRAAGDVAVPIDVPVTPRDAEGDVDFSKETPVAIHIPADEIRALRFTSDQDLTVSARPFVVEDVGVEGKERVTYRIAGDEPYQWKRGDLGIIPFTGEWVETFYVSNHGASQARGEIVVTVAPAFPEVRSIPITALSIWVLFIVTIFVRTVAPKLNAIALATYKSEIAQPLFAILIALGVFAILVFVLLPYNTLGEDIKMLKDLGFSLIMILCLVQAIWASSTSVSEEIEGRTALTVLSKPIRRHSFIFGKYLGITWTVGLMFLVLGLVFLIMVAYKPIYDGRENSKTDVTWQLCHFEMIATVPGLLLSFMQSLVLAAVSVAISTRLPLLANFAICFTVYVLGNITPVLVQSAAQQFELVAFFAQLIATVVPNLESFNMQAAIASAVEVPVVYLGWALLYCALYSVVALLLALAMFEDRDLA